MSTPLYSAHLGDVFPRGIVVGLSPMAADPAQADLTLDFALQLVIEAHRHAGVRPGSTGDAKVFDQIVELYLEQRRAAFCDAAQYYIYYAVAIDTFPSAERADRSSSTLAIASRLPWLVGALRPGMLWESTAHSFAVGA